MPSKSKWTRLFDVKSGGRRSHTVRAFVVKTAFLLLLVPLVVLRVNAPTAHAAAGSNVLNPGETLQVNQTLTSPNGSYTGCIYPSVTYYGKGNFFNVISETLSAEVCFGSGNVWTVWTNHKFSGYPGWSGTELGRGVFWDPGRYGGALTIWSNDQDTFGWGPTVYNEDTFLRIWVTPNGQEYQYGGL